MYPNTALILEGGAVRGVFTSGVLDYLMEQNFYLPYVVGVSAGACNAVDYLSKQVGRTRDCTIIKEKQYQYFNLKKTLKNRSLFDMDMIFDRFPNEIYPFDYETYFQSDMLCELVVTNCLTGRAMYLTEKQNKERLMTICRASSSIPIASPMVSVDGIPCLDGGLSDSIPLLHTMRNGCRKNVVVLTRNKGYRKKVRKSQQRFYRMAYRKYPKLAETICHRAEVYNRTLELIEKWEKEGRIFAIRPEIPAVSRTEQDYEVLTNFYRHGYDLMEQKFEELKKFLDCPSR